MNRLCSPIATAVSLLAVSLPAQEQQAPRPVAARPQRVTLLPQGVEDARRAKMIALVEKLASGELTDAERAECKRALLEMMAGSRSAQPRKAVVVEVEEAGDDDAPVRWRVNTAKPVEERREVRVVRPAPVREWVQKSGEGDGEARVRYRMIEGGKGKGLVLRARDDEPSGDAPEAKQERRVFMFKERPNAEGLEARITKVLEEVGGALEIDVQVHDERDERDERRRRVVRRLRRDRDEEEGGHGHGEHEHGHDDDHGHGHDDDHGHGHGHDDDHDEHHEHAVVEELFGMIEAMRDEMRGLREMVAELHRMLHEQRGADRGARGRFGRRR
jgi:hypothetical protein